MVRDQKKFGNRWSNHYIVIKTVRRASVLSSDRRDFIAGVDTGGDAGYALPPTRPKEVLTRHLISLKIIAKNIFVLHTKN